MLETAYSISKTVSMWIEVSEKMYSLPLEDGEMFIRSILYILTFSVTIYVYCN